MKMKRFLLMLAVSFSCSLSFYAQGKQVLKSIEEKKIGAYYMNYFYREDGLMDYRQGEDYYGVYKVVFKYDDNNNVIRRELYQDYNFVMTLVAYHEYEYDNDGKLTRKCNWNMLEDGSFAENPDGDVTYVYNEDGTLKESTTKSLVGNQYKLYNKNTYSYSEGKLIKIDVLGPNGPDSYDIYKYDPKKRLTWEGHYVYSGATASLDSQRRYWYDRNSNLQSESYSIGSTVQDSTYYFYSTEKAEDYIYPYDMEEVPEPVYMECLQNKITGYQKYNLEESSWTLVDTERYEFIYGDLTSVESVKNVSEDNISVVIDGDFGLVFGVKDRFADFVITDLAGRVVLKGNLKSGTFAPYLLNRGIYVLTVEGKSVKFRK